MSVEGTKPVQTLERMWVWIGMWLAKATAIFIPVPVVLDQGRLQSKIKPSHAAGLQVEFCSPPGFRNAFWCDYTGLGKEWIIQTTDSNTQERTTYRT